MVLASLRGQRNATHAATAPSIIPEDGDKFDAEEVEAGVEEICDDMLIFA